MNSPIYIAGQDPGVEITNWEWGHAELHGASSGRSDNTGVAQIDRIGNARTLVVEVAPNQSAAAVSRLLNLIRPKEVMFEVTYYDYLALGWRSDRFYAADIRIPMPLIWPEDLVPGVSTDFSGISCAAFTLEFIHEGESEEDAYAGKDGDA